MAGRCKAENDGSVIEQWDEKGVQLKARKHGHVECIDVRVDWFSSNIHSPFRSEVDIWLFSR